MPPPIDRRRLVRWAGLGLGLAMLLGLAVLIGDPFAPTYGPGTDPEAYRELVALGEAVAGWDRVPADVAVGQADEATLDALLAANPGRLDDARRLLDGRPGATPEATADALSARMDEVAALRNLARLFQAEARRAALRGDPATAARAGLDLLRLSQAIGRDGLLIDRLTALAVESTGFAALAGVIDDLDEPTLATIAATLKDRNGEREPTARLLKRDRDLALQAGGLGPRIAYVLSPGSFQTQLQAATDRLDAAERRGETYAALLAAEVAIRRYRLAHGRDPATLGDLVPAQLAVVPIDPYASGSPLIYRPADGDDRPRSVGPDRVDSGGRPISADTPWPQAQGDARLADLLTPPG